MKRSIKIWIISMLVTLIVYLVSWIIVEANINGYVVVTTCIALSVINAAYGIIQVCLNVKKYLHISRSFPREMKTPPDQDRVFDFCTLRSSKRRAFSVFVQS